MKILDKEEFKVYKFTYKSSFQSLALANLNDKTIISLKCNNTIKNEYDYYILNTKFGSIIFDEDAQQFEAEHKLNIKNVFCYLHNAENSKFKIMNNDIPDDIYNEGGVELMGSDFIVVYKIDDTFYFCCYQENLDDLEAYDKYLSNIENVREAEKVMKEND